MAKEQDKKEAAETAAAPAETVTAPEGQPQQQLRIDETTVATYFSSTSRIWGTAEEIIVDFSQGVRPTGQKNVAMLKIDARVVMSPWAAKRLAIALGQTVQRYEQAYGILEIDPRKRVQGGATTMAR
jgi:hypothetical protein